MFSALLSAIMHGVFAPYDKKEFNYGVTTQETECLRAGGTMPHCSTCSTLPEHYPELIISVWQKSVVLFEQLLNFL